MSTIRSIQTEVLADPANPQLLVHITDDEGTTGTGETWWAHYRPDLEPGAPVIPYKAMIDALLGPSLHGVTIAATTDIDDVLHELIRATYQYGDDGIVRGALSGIDLALWDLLGRRNDKPVASMLGPRRHDRIPVYASLTWHGHIDQILEDISAAAAAGFTAAKLHESDPSLIAAVRHEVDPAFKLMVDVSAAYDEPGSRALVAELDDLGLTWIEEPLYPQRDYLALARIRASSSTPLASGENEFSLAGITALVDAGAADIVQPEIAKIGGLTEARRSGAALSSRGVSLAPHNFSPARRSLPAGTGPRPNRRHDGSSSRGSRPANASPDAWYSRPWTAAPLGLRPGPASDSPTTERRGNPDQRHTEDMSTTQATSVEPGASTAPVEVEDPVDDIVVSRDTPWIVLVWNDPINLMSYVTFVLQKLFGYSESKANKLMLDVHQKGRAVVSQGPREKAELDVFRLHEHGLWATMQQD